MKFQSLIAAIMHGGLPAARGLLVSLCLVSTGGMSLIAGKHTYSASSSAVRVNGADIRMQVKPDGRTERKLVLFRMNPAEKRQDEFIFLPAEVVQNIGKSAEEWDDQGWD